MREAHASTGGESSGRQGPLRLQRDSWQGWRPPLLHLMMQSPAEHHTDQPLHRRVAPGCARHQPLSSSHLPLGVEGVPDLGLLLAQRGDDLAGLLALRDQRGHVAARLRLLGAQRVQLSVGGLALGLDGIELGKGGPGQGQGVRGGEGNGSGCAPQADPGVASFSISSGLHTMLG